jgi:O-antigen/teichoic acid export membrane protein
MAESHEGNLGATGFEASSIVASTTLTLLTGRFATAVLAWSGTLIIVRSLSTRSWGAYAFVFSILGIIGLLCDLQVSRVVLRELMADPDDAGSVLGSFLLFRLALGIFGYAVAVGVVAAAHYPPVVVVTTAAAGSTLIFGAFGAALTLGFSSQLWLRPTAVAAVAGQAVQLGAIIAVAALWPHNVVYFAVTSVLGSLVLCVYQLAVIGRVVPVRFRVDARQWRRWLREAIPLTLGVTVGTIYFRIDSVILSKLKSLRAVGYYNIGYKFSDLAGIATVAVFASALPLMVRWWPTAPSRFHHTVRHALLLLVVIAAVIGVEFVCFGGPAISTLYGHRYRVTVGATGGLVAGQLVAYFTLLCFMVQVTVGRPWRYVGAAVFGLAFNVGLNLLLIPRWSYNGAAAATVITEVAVLIWLVPGTISVPHVRPLPYVPIFKVMASAVVIGGVGWVMRDRVSWPIGAGLVLVLFAVALHLVRVDGGGLQGLWRPSQYLEREEPSSDTDGGSESGPERVP